MSYFNAELGAAILAAEMEFAAQEGQIDTCPTWDRCTLLQILDKVRPFEFFGRDVLYNRSVPLDADKIEIDLYYENMMPAPHVKPCDPAPMAAHRTSHGTLVAEPGYVKLMDTINCCKPFPRYAGQRPWNSLSTLQQQQLTFAYKTRMLELSVQLTEELSIWEQLITGRNKVYNIDLASGEMIHKSTIDFKREPVLGSFVFNWNKDAKCIGTDLRRAYREVACAGGGAITDLIGGWRACDALTDNTDFKEQVKCAREADFAALMDVDLNFTPRSDFRFGGVELIGRIGNVRLWCNTQFYMCPESGEKKFMMPEDCLIGVSKDGTDFDAGLMRLYGVIRICDVMVPMERHMESWTERNPSCRNIKIESSPFAMMLCSNSTFKAKIVTEK